MENQTEKKPINDVKDVVIVVARSVAVGVEAKQNDGKIDFKDLPLLFKVVPAFGPMIDGIQNVPEQLADMDESEAGELVSAIMTEFNIADVAARELIEISFQAIAINIKLVKKIQAVIKKPAA